jgi:hypothetical protein
MGITATFLWVSARVEAESKINILEWLVLIFYFENLLDEKNSLFIRDGGEFRTAYIVNELPGIAILGLFLDS